MDKLIKIILAALFLICLANMPYGYYQLVRFAAMVGFAILAYLAFERQKNVEVIIYLGLVVLFQPIVKFALGREIWNIVDVITAIFLIGSLFYRSKR